MRLQQWSAPAATEPQTAVKVTTKTQTRYHWRAFTEDKTLLLGDGHSSPTAPSSASYTMAEKTGQHLRSATANTGPTPSLSTLLGHQDNQPATP